MSKNSFEIESNEKSNLLHSNSLSSLSSRPSPSNFIYLIVLISMCFISINNYFCYHAPSAIAYGYESYYGINTKQFGTLFTIYSAPNIILVFFSGQFIDKVGLRKSSLIFNSFILISVILAAFTPSSSHDEEASNSTSIYILLLLSRLLLGLGGESICACVNTMISRWFSSTNHLNTAMSLNQSSVQLFGSAAAFYILPRMPSIVLCQWVCVGVSVLCLLANLVYNCYETIYENYLDEVNEIKDENMLHQIHDTPTNNGHATNSNYQAVPTTVDIEHAQKLASQAKASNENLLVQSCHTLRRFPTIFWILLLHISLVSPILYTFTAFGPMYLQETFPSSISATEAGDAISLLYSSILGSPMTGMLVDMVGYRSYVQFFASCNIPVLFLLLTYGMISPNIAMIAMGVIFSITESNGMALISLVVPSELTGTAYGLYACSISFALLLEPAAVGSIREMTGSFAWSIWIFFGLTSLGSLVALAVVIYDKRHDNLISKSSEEA